MRTCLVIDDSSVVRKVAGRILTKLDVATAEACGGEEGIEKLRASAPRMILVAASLPDMASDDFVRQVRAMPDCAETTILAMLVEAHLGQMTRLKRAGANGFVFKPFDRASLSRWIDPYLATGAAA